MRGRHERRRIAFRREKKSHEAYSSVVNKQQPSIQKELAMAKFLVKGSYSTEGTKGLLKEGGSSRKAAVEKMIKGLGGSVEAFYYAFGDTDVFVICDLPDSVTAAGISLAINATGTVNVSLVPLLTVQDIDQASKKSVGYRAPGA
jgi:uncharacterized protein with GYD domain